MALNNSGKVIGTTGIYVLADDEEDSAWLGWFCVDEKHRGKGYGQRLLEFTMQKGREMGKKKLKLYTSTEPSEEVAQKLYAKKGFILFKEEILPDKPYKKLYKQVNL